MLNKLDSQLGWAYMNGLDDQERRERKEEREEEDRDLLKLTDNDGDATVPVSPGGNGDDAQEEEGTNCIKENVI